MPGTLLLVNPSAPRRRMRSRSSARGNPEWARKLGRGTVKAGKKAREYGQRARKYADESFRDFREGYREARGNPYAMYDRPVRLSAHRPSRPRKVEVGAKRTNPKKKKAAKKKAAPKKRSSEMRKNPAKKKAASKKAAAPKRRRRPAAAKKAAAPKRRRRPAAAKKAAAPKRRRRPAAAKKVMSKSKRSAAAKKGWRARRAAAAKAAPRKKAASKRSVRKASIKSLKSAVKRAKPRSASRAIVKARLAARRVQKRAPSMSKAQRGAMRRHGLNRVNPSLKAAFQDFIGLIPEMGVGVLATAGAAWAGQKAGAKLAAMSWMPAAAKPFAVPVATSGVTIAAYMASKMSAKTQRFSLPILVGGMAAVAVHTLAAVKTKEGKSLGQKLGLPIGSYVAIGEYIPQSLGAHYGEHLGDYTAIGAPVLDVDGAEVRLNGMFSESSLGTEMPATFSQMGYGREPARALNSPGDPTVEEVLGEESGVLSGSIFD